MTKSRLRALCSSGLLRAAGRQPSRRRYGPASPASTAGETPAATILPHAGRGRGNRSARWSLPWARESAGFFLGAEELTCQSWGGSTKSNKLAKTQFADMLRLYFCLDEVRPGRWICLTSPDDVMHRGANEERVKASASGVEFTHYATVEPICYQ